MSSCEVVSMWAYASLSREVEYLHRNVLGMSSTEASWLYIDVSQWAYASLPREVEYLHRSGEIPRLCWE